MLQDYTVSELENLLGPWLTTGPNAFDASDVPQGRGLLAQNVEYRPGLVKTRYGFSRIASGLNSLTDSFIAMNGWLSPSFSGPVSYLVYLAKAGSTNPGYNVITSQGASFLHLYTPAGTPAGGCIVPIGTRVYMTSFDSTGTSTDNAHVYSQTTVAAPGGVDTLFQGPITITSSGFSDGGASSALGVTLGQHNFGILLQTRNGYTGAASPINGSSVFSPFSFSVVTAGRALIVSVTATWPTSVDSVFLMMTTADNLAQYYVLPNPLGVIGGLSSTINFLVDIDDGTLAATAQSATAFFSLLSGSLKVSAIAEYNNRVVYTALDAIGVPTAYISDAGNPQAIRQGTSVIYLPGQRPQTCAFSLYGVLCLVGPHWTYLTQDNGGDPVTWSGPQIIDGQIGTLSPNGVSVNATAGVAFVADVNGLYIFSGGAYQTRPLNYYQKSDWMNINWAGAGMTVRVLSNSDTQRVHVLVPLNGATSPSHIMTFDYSQGLTPEAVNYSLDSLSSYSLGAVGMVQNDANRRVELWLGPGSTSLPVLRQNNGLETNPYRDDAQAVASQYQTGLMPRLGSSVMQHVADQIRITGAGTVTLTAKSLDGGRSVALTNINPTGTPAEVFIRRYYIISEATTLTFGVSGLDSFFMLSDISHFFKELVKFR